MEADPGRQPIELPPVSSDPFSESRILRWGKIGCIAGLVLAAAALLASFLLLQRGMLLLAERAMDRIESSLPIEIDEARRDRTLSNIGKLQAAIRHGSDSELLVSRFLAAAAPALEDDELTLAELEAINTEIEALLDPRAWSLGPDLIQEGQDHGAAQQQGTMDALADGEAAEERAADQRGRPDQVSRPDGVAE